MTNAQELILDSMAGEQIAHYSKSNPFTGEEEELFDVYKGITSATHPIPENVRLFWALDSANDIELAGFAVEERPEEVEVNAQLSDLPKELGEDSCLRLVTSRILARECKIKTSEKPVFMRVCQYGLAGSLLEEYVDLEVAA